jgi:S1-C subfamily serine protease
VLGAIVQNVPLSIGLAIFIGPLVSASTSHAEAFSACLRAKIAFEKIERCSVVIRHSRRAGQLERAYLKRGNAYVEINRFADAVNDFTSVIKINPTIAGYYDNRQYALKSMGRLREALDDANTAIRLAPTYSFVYRSRGNVNDAMGRFDSAIADYTKGLLIEPRDAGLLIDRGKTLAKAGRNGEAIADFSHALDIDAKAIVAFRERGLVYMKLGDFAASIADLTWFTRFEPGDQEVVRAIEEMQAAASSPRQAGLPPTKNYEQPPAVAPPEGSFSSGSGFFVGDEGYVLTNNHVIEDCTSTRVFMGNAAAVNARIIARDAANDLALLSTTLKPRRAAAMRFGLKQGESVAAFGYPYADVLASSGNFTLGNVTALAGIDDDSRYLQMSAPVQAGNSGGPLLDQNGNLIGVVTAKLNALKFKRDFPQNVNFAVKASIVVNFLDANRIDYALGSSNAPLKSEDLADLAKSISVFILCK